MLEWWKRLTFSRLQDKIALRAAAEYLWRALRLPLRFFTSRFAGDIASRLSISDAITRFFARDAPDALLDVFGLVFFSILMLMYSVPLTLAAWGAATLSMCAFFLFAARLKTEQLVLQQERGKAIGFMVQVISMLETIKARAEEPEVLQRTMENKSRVINAEQVLNLLQNGSVFASDALRLLGNAAVLAVGGFYVMDSRMTLGELVGFQTLMASFVGPVSGFLRVATSSQEMAVLCKRVEDVTEYRAEHPDDLAPICLESAERLWTDKVKRLEARSLHFGYSGSEGAYLQDVSFSVEAGHAIAFVGKTVSGKSTIAKIVGGLYLPWEGAVYWDGVPDREIPPEVRQTSVAFVDQSICLFAGSIRDNITLWDPTIPSEVIARAAADACLHEVILRKPRGYDHHLEENGRNLSGGERQRLELARALALEPSVLIMDEATSALDPATELQIMTNVRKRGCACLIVAHRLSTIRDCDEILLLEQGHVVAPGCHESLMAECDVYRRLVNHE